MSMTSWINRVRAAAGLVTGLSGRRAQDDELDEEISFHIVQATERNVRRGMSPDDAHRTALITFGGRTRWTEDARDQQRSRFVDDFRQDFVYGVAGLRRLPGFAAGAIITIALGVAATTTVFSFVNSVYLRPLGVPEGGRLVRIFGADRPDFDRELGFPAYRVIRQQTRTFDAVAAHYSTAPLFLTSRGESAEVMGAVVSAAYFPMLGIRPALGRFFTAAEDSVPDRDAVAVIGHDLWQNRFGGDAGVIGEQVTINGRTFTIVGVAPRDFTGIVAGWVNEMWIPAMMLHTGYRWCDGFTRSCAITSIMARTAPGKRLAEARAEIAALRASILDSTNPSDSIRTIATTPATGVPRWQQRDYAQLSTLLSIIAVVLMAVACANLSGLLLARGITRQKEIALRASLGADRGRIARQLLTESLTLGLAGAVAGVVLSLWTSRALVGFFAKDDEGYLHRLVVSVDWRVAAFAIVVTLAAVCLFGLLPALRVSRIDAAETLKAGGGSLSKSRARTVLVAGQMTLALSLLIAAGLLARSFSRLMTFGNLDSAHLAQLRLRPRLVGYGPDTAQAYLRRALKAIAEVPGVRSVAPVRGSLVRQATDDAMIAIPGSTLGTGKAAPEVDYFDIGPGYFATLEVPLIVGREFNDRDTPATPLVAMVNETLARRLWSSLDVVGKTITLNGKAFEVVGVVRDYRVHRFAETPPASAYVAFWQNSFEPQIDARVAVRVDGDPRTALSAIRRAITAVDPNVPVTETITSLEQRRAEHTEVRLGGAVLVVSAGIALFLTAVGLFGVVSFLVAHRAKEVGIRLAVGAQPLEVVRLFVRQGLRPVWFGIALGLAVSIWLVPLLSRWLFAIAPFDVGTFVAAVAVVLAVGFFASWLPARRAAGTDPAVVFRVD